MRLARLLDMLPVRYDLAAIKDVFRALLTQVDGISEGRVAAFHGAMSAAPTSGTWVRGDIVKNSLPSPSNHAFFICVESGSPGTWKGFGQIEA